ncbi:MAG TPA: hypothetical protein VF282_08445 [Bacillota bacterium]
MLTVGQDLLTYGPGQRIYVPLQETGTHELSLWFAARLDDDAAGRIRVDPEEALAHLAATHDDSPDRGSTSVRLLLTPPNGGSEVTITIEAGLAAADGRTLPEPATFAVVFMEPTQVELAVTGTTYDPTGEDRRFTGADTAAHPPILRPGPAVLEAVFTRPVDPEGVEEALRRRLPAAIRAGIPTWNADHTQLQLPLFQNVTQTLTVTLSLGQAAGQPVVRDLLGMPLVPANPDLAWIVAVQGRVVTVDGPGTADDPLAGAGPAGQLPQLPLLRPAGAAAIQAGRMLAWHSPYTADACGPQSLTLWHLSSGTGLPLADDVDGCLAWAAWVDEDTAVLVDRERAVRYHVPQATPAAEVPPDPQPIARWTPESGVVVGAALAPGAPVAVFHAPRAETAGAVNLGGTGRVDLLFLNAGGEVDRRIANVSDLVSQEPAWSSLPAAWSPDGRVLAFVSYRADAERDDAGYPRRIEARLTMVDAATGRVTGWDLAPLDLIWRPGRGTLWVRTPEGWYEFDPATERLQPVATELWWAFAFSPDGRFLTGQGAEGPMVIDASTGRRVSAPAARPLGWDPADGRAYWFEPPSS